MRPFFVKVMTDEGFTGYKPGDWDELSPYLKQMWYKSYWWHKTRKDTTNDT